MHWEAIGALGEVVGAAAVVISLIYLAVQIRHNSSHLKNAADDSLSLRYATALSLIAQNSENAKIFHYGMTHPDSLTEEQIARFGYMIGLLITHMN